MGEVWSSQEGGGGRGCPSPLTGQHSQEMESIYTLIVLGGIDVYLELNKRCIVCALVNLLKIHRHHTG